MARYASDLLPEAYLLDLKRKIDSSGIEFDDAASIENLLYDSFELWIYFSKDFSQCLDQSHSVGITQAIFKLYNSLKPEDKATVKSSAGLSLAKYDPVWIADFFHAQKIGESAYVGWGKQSEAEQTKRYDEQSLKERALSDPNIISTMVMHVRSEPAYTRIVHFKNSEGREIITGGLAPHELQLYRYSLIVDYKIDGKNYKIDAPFNLPLPIWSPEREAEIIKAINDEKSM